MKKIDRISSLETHIGYWMRFVSNHVSHSFSKKLEADGITVAEWVVLRELFETEELAPSQLADKLGLTRGAISKLVERLVGKALVNRSSAEGDGRFQVVALTPAGRALVPRLAHLADENDAEFFGHLDPKQQEALRELLEEIVRRRGLKNPPLK